MRFVSPYLPEVERLGGDFASLQKHRAALTDEPLALLAVSRSGVTAKGLTASYGPAELLRAWQPR